MRRLLVAILIVAIGGCTSSPRSADGPSSTETPPRGGTLRLSGANAWEFRNWDPATYASGHQNALFRCCLLRRLYSYPGRPGDEGGSVPQPDLATAMPEVSGDGLTWTIGMKEGLRYAPPYDDREIVAGDVVEALLRQAALTRRASTEPDLVAPDLGWGAYFSPIAGYDDVVAGSATTISGLETPDDHTLVVHLREPTGDLTDLLATSASAPLPPGVADGHDGDYFRFLVASGPYMVEGSDDVEPGEPIQPMRGHGWEPFTILERNPSWDSTTDAVRAAYPDRIEFVLLPVGYIKHFERLVRGVQEGTIDVVANPPRSVVRATERGEIAGRIVAERANEQLYYPMNAAVPPFDDVHVRRAVNLAIDRDALRAAWLPAVDSPLALTWHMVPASVQGYRVPDTWRPSWGTGVPDAGDPRAAREEMARSRYDEDGDGRCDGDACRVWSVRSPFSLAGTWHETRRALATVGVILDVRQVSAGRWWRFVSEPAHRLPLVVDIVWQSDYPNATTSFLPLYSGRSITAVGNDNFSLIGASPGRLRSWGYDVQEVPSIDDRIARCRAMTGAEGSVCWTDLDIYLMEEITPAIPVGSWDRTLLLSDRIVAYSFDQSTNWLAYDRIALAPNGDDSS